MYDFFGEPIYTYTRQQALNDGVLIDVTELAIEAGFKLPVAITNTLYTIINTVGENIAQDATGRLWDVLWMAKMAAHRHTDVSQVMFSLHLPYGRKKKQELKMVVGPGDTGEPVITIMMIDED